MPAHAGPVYEVITADNDNSLVGNFSCKLTTLNANTVQAKLPSSFDAEQELTTGSYTAVYTYYPTSNFTQPDSLTLTFEIMVRASPCQYLSVTARECPALQCAGNGLGLAAPAAAPAYELQIRTASWLLLFLQASVPCLPDGSHHWGICICASSLQWWVHCCIGTCVAMLMTRAPGHTWISAVAETDAMCSSAPSPSRRLCCWRALSAAPGAGGQGLWPERGAELRAAACAEPDSSEGAPQPWLLLVQNLTFLFAAYAESDAPAATASAAAAAAGRARACAATAPAPGGQRQHDAGAGGVLQPGQGLAQDVPEPHAVLLGDCLCHHHHNGKSALAFPSIMSREEALCVCA